ncbi:hypothetical protein [Mesorhizobium sp.]|uniref:hypothetical protein n=1 Tax=Mesorhizobium sp. TaxID=1871066 RepID=UPI001210789C|nr:hypothetical protein [Mesorhizobium sp.]TIP18479.1 MAG: hypothetical protein E5X66_16035 [Mesorhizobium sp.]
MAAASGTLVGIGGTLALYPTQDQLSAAIASEPPLCAKLAAAGLEIPSPAEALLGKTKAMALSRSPGDPMAGKRCSFNDRLHANVWFRLSSRVYQQSPRNPSCSDRR